MTTIEQARDALAHCKCLIDRIDARGGPVPGTEEEYARARSWVEGNLTMLDDPELGGLLVGSMLAAGAAYVGYLLWQVSTPLVKGGTELIETAATVGKVAMWSGLAWLGWQMVQSGRRRSA